MAFETGDDSARCTLTGDSVLLEPLLLAHHQALTEAVRDSSVGRWMSAPLANADDVRRFIEDALRARENGTSMPFATVDRASSTVVGSTRFGNIDRAHRRLEIGWTFIAPQWQRTRINTEAKYLMLRHAFEDHAYIRVEFKTDALNERSRAAIRRLGAHEEGTLRNHMIVAGGRVRDSVYFSILDREWPAVKASLETKLRAELRNTG